MNTSTASTTRAAVTQHWAGKAPSLSKGKWLKRALGAALKRDRSTRQIDTEIAEYVMHFAKHDMLILPLHDSFLIRFGYEESLEQVM